MTRTRRTARGATAVEVAVAFAIVGVALATIVPACIRSVHLARTAEAVEYTEKILTAAVVLRARLPRVALTSAPLTPSVVPRGERIIDPPRTWDHATWRSIGFSIDEPHWYAYRLDVDTDPATPLRVVANGDLDGDGVLSTFERSAANEGGTAVQRPGLTVTADLE